MNISRFCVLLVFFLFFEGISSLAQVADELTSTNTVDGLSPRHRKLRNKKVTYIIKKNTREILYGNKCVEEYTRDMGFMYLVIPKGQPGYESELDRFFHNFGAKAKLFFTKGPFWKLRVKKRIKECRKKTGDFVG